MIKKKKKERRDNQYRNESLDWVIAFLNAFQIDSLLSMQQSKYKFENIFISFTLIYEHVTGVSTILACKCLEQVKKKKTLPSIWLLVLVHHGVTCRDWFELIGETIGVEVFALNPCIDSHKHMHWCWGWQM